MEKGLRHRDEGDRGDKGDCKKGMAEVAAWQNFGAAGLGLTLASQLAEMIPEATGFALQSPYLLKSDNLNTASVSSGKQGLGGEHPFYPLG